MKKYLSFGILILTSMILSYCSASKRATASTPVKLTYSTNMKNVIETNCTPCHIPAKGGNKKAYDDYANLKLDIDEAIRRIELNPGDKGFMPFRKAHRLPDSTIAVFKQWKADGLIE